jgi:hypothetical protein
VGLRKNLRIIRNPTRPHRTSCKEVPPAILSLRRAGALPLLTRSRSMGRDMSLCEATGDPPAAKIWMVASQLPKTFPVNEFEPLGVPRTHPFSRFRGERCEFARGNGGPERETLQWPKYGWLTAPIIATAHYSAHLQVGSDFFSNLFLTCTHGGTPVDPPVVKIWMVASQLPDFSRE